MTRKIARFRRIGTAVCFILAATLFLAGIVIAPWEADDTRAAWYDALRGDPDRAQAAAVFLHFGFLLYVPAFFGVLALMRGKWGMTGHIAAITAALGLATMSGFLINDFYDLGIAQTMTNEEAAVLDATMDGMWGIPIMAIPAFLGATLGTVVLYVALWRAGWVQAWIPAASLASVIVTVVAPSSLLWSGIYAALGLVAAVGVAARIFRLSDEEWARGAIKPQSVARVTVTAPQAETV